MDGKAHSISSSDLYARMGRATAPLLLDVRRDQAFSDDGFLIIGALRRSPGEVAGWSSDLITSRPVVTYCVHGHEVSQGVAATLRHAGLDAAYLEGGIAGWREKALPTRKNLGAIEANWVTREHPKIDRIACPWLVSRFINPLAAFRYVPADQVVTVAKQEEATPYDIKDVQFGHVGDHCSLNSDCNNSIGQRTNRPSS